MKKFRKYFNKQIILDFFLRLSGANLLASNQVGKVVPSTFLTLPRGSAFSTSPYFIPTLNWYKPNISFSPAIIISLFMIRVVFINHLSRMIIRTIDQISLIVLLYMQKRSGPFWLMMLASWCRFQLIHFQKNIFSLIFFIRINNCIFIFQFLWTNIVNEW